MEIENLFENLPDRGEEIFELLLQSSDLRIERIVSSGQTTSEGEWYDQERHEWVALLKGRARLRFEQDDEVLEMAAGDHILIPAHTRHRVEWTDPSTKSVWLAVHFLERAEDAGRTEDH